MCDCTQCKKLRKTLIQMESTYLKSIDELNRKIEGLRFYIQLLEENINHEEQTSSEG